MQHGQVLDNARIVSAACDRWLRARGMVVYTMKDIIKGACKVRFAEAKERKKEERLQSLDQEDGE